MLKNLGSLLVILGIYAVVLYLAIAYWALDLGDAAILFCTVFFYLVFAGPGAWSLDITIRDRS